MSKEKQYWALKYDEKTLRIMSLSEILDRYEHWTVTSTPKSYYGTIVRTTKERCLTSYCSMLNKELKFHNKKIQQLTKIKDIVKSKYEVNHE